jgi:hypothetical protein
MASYSRLILQFAAAIGIVVMLSALAPPVAAESAGRPSETSATAGKTVPPVIKRHASRGIVRSHLDCASAWCGRQFVLMVGVAY